MVLPAVAAAYLRVPSCVCLRWLRHTHTPGPRGHDNHPLVCRGPIVKGPEVGGQSPTHRLSPGLVNRSAQRFTLHSLPPLCWSVCRHSFYHRAATRVLAIVESLSPQRKIWHNWIQFSFLFTVWWRQFSLKEINKQTKTSVRPLSGTVNSGVSHLNPARGHWRQ